MRRVKPGDLIEWVYRHDETCRVIADEAMWSTPLQCYVPIGSRHVHLLVSIDDTTMMWLNTMGLFHAKVSDLRSTEKVVGYHSVRSYAVKDSPAL